MSGAKGFVTCPQGHRWKEPSLLSPEKGLLCPQCGLPMAKEPQASADVATAPPPDSHDVSSARPISLQRHETGSSYGRFRILRSHAQGGLGQVSLAQDEELGREVALKEIRPEFARNPVSRDRFLNEARITSQLEHPNIVPVYALGRDAQARPFYVMRFVRGQSLHHAIRDYHKSPTPDAFRALLRRFIDVCQAVAYAHSRGIIHRDLKPANVMLGEYGQTLVVDWGVAKDLSSKSSQDVLAGSAPVTAEVASPLTQAQSALGTRAYMAPEQAGDSSKATIASDIYSLGTILREIVTGKPDAVTAASATRSARPLLAVSQKATASAPEARYASASDLADEVERYLADQSLRAYRDPVAVRALRWAKGHRSAVAASLVFLLCSIAALTVITILVTRQRNAKESALQQVKRERDRADEQARIAEAVNNFLNEDLLQQASVFAQASDLPPDRDLKIRDALDRAADRITTRFKDEPVVESAIRMTIGETYRRLGEPVKAEQHMRAAVELRRQALGEHHPSTLQATGAIGQALIDQRKFREAEELLLKVLSEQQATVGEHHRDTIVVMNTLGNLYSAEGRTAKSLELWRRGAEIAVEVFGENHEAALSVRQNLAVAYLAAGDNVRAQKMLEGILAASDVTRGKLHPYTVSARDLLAIIYRRQGRLAEAEQLLTSALADGEQVLSPQDPRRLELMNDLARVYDAEGRGEDSDQLINREIALARTMPSPAHLANALHNAASIESRSKGNKTAAADSHQLEALQIWRKIGDMAGLEKTLAQRGALLKKEGRYEDATGVQRECLAVRQKLYTPEDYRIPSAKAALGESLEKSGKLDEAEPWLLTAERELAACPANPITTARVADARRDLVWLYGKMHKPDQAAAWQKKLPTTTAPLDGNGE